MRSSILEPEREAMPHKRRKAIFKLVSITVSSFLLVSVMPAYAYLDPGSGSMVLQIVLGGVAGLVVILKLYWNRLVSLFETGKKKRKIQN